MNDYFQQIRSGTTLPRLSIRQLMELGFVTVPGPLSGDQFNKSMAAYDGAMAVPGGPDFRVGSTTTRLSDLLSYSSVFDEVFLHPPLLEAATHFIGEPFKLSSFLARTLRGGSPAQELHADLPRNSEDAPMLGFILIMDPFLEENGATRFVPTSHLWKDLPEDRVIDTRAKYPGEILACGEPGTMVLFNGATWHGHTANTTRTSRRSIQGYFVRRSAQSGFDFKGRLPSTVQLRMSHFARHLLNT